MPTPIGHALAGLAIARATGRSAVSAPSRTVVLILCAMAPDLDLLSSLVDGANRHRGASHSLGAAILAGAAALLLRRLGFGVPGAWAVCAAWSSHVLLDFLGIDTSPPSGEMALWPLSTRYFISPIPVFYDVRRAFTAAAVEHNLVGVAIELALLVPIVLFCWRGGPARSSPK